VNLRVQLDAQPVGRKHPLGPAVSVPMLHTVRSGRLLSVTHRCPVCQARVSPALRSRGGRRRLPTRTLADAPVVSASLLWLGLVSGRERPASDPTRHTPESGRPESGRPESGRPESGRRGEPRPGDSRMSGEPVPPRVLAPP
jgi:hypothetical protein